MKKPISTIAARMLLPGMLLAATTMAHAQNPPIDATRLQAAPHITTPAAAHAVNFPNATLAALDDFNRADGPLGPNWTVHDGACNVVGNAATCTGVGRATFNGASGSGDEAEMDIAIAGPNLDYVALLLNYGAGNNNLFIKAQSQDGGSTFDHAGCYTGNNGAGFGAGFFSLSTPFATAHMKATRVGDTVTLVFSNIDGGAGTQTYTCNGAPAREGTGIGIAGYGGVDRLDNFGGQGNAVLAGPPRVVPAADWRGLLALALGLFGVGFLVLRKHHG